MDKKINITTDLETLTLVRKALSYYLDDLDAFNDFKDKDYYELEKAYNVLCDLTFEKEWRRMKELQTDITFNSRITIQNRISKDNNIYQVMQIGIVNEKTGEVLNIHEVYIKENLRQIIEFIISQNN